MATQTDFLPVFTEFLKQKIHEGLTTILHQAVESEIERVVDQAVKELEPYIQYVRDQYMQRELYDVVVRLIKK